MAVSASLAATLAGCGSSQPQSAMNEAGAKAELKGAPAPLKSIRSQANEILDGGTSAFKRRIDQLDGYPIVVNKWASWCGPCRFEFPFFQKQARKHGAEIAFLGDNSEDARDDAEEFLAKFPVPYPSYFDPDGEISALYRGDRVFPTTAFYNSMGKLVFTKQGGYPSEQALVKDIRRHAR
ncbi:hypothetical protein LCGC14_2202600 [marine sediment metagenome]|uniref:Thioredoxin domain-containing protein n=1 Tax=marine sediment metagenome TaxID=412755 RepID=A0A0F9DG66_9ZZZZ